MGWLFIKFDGRAIIDVTTFGAYKATGSAMELMDDFGACILVKVVNVVCDHLMNDFLVFP